MVTFPLMDILNIYRLDLVVRWFVWYLWSDQIGGFSIVTRTWLAFRHLEKTIEPSARLCSIAHSILMSMLERLEIKLKNHLKFCTYTKLTIATLMASLPVVTWWRRDCPGGETSWWRDDFKSLWRSWVRIVCILQVGVPLGMETFLIKEFNFGADFEGNLGWLCFQTTA